MMADETTALGQVLRSYQQASGDGQAEARLAIALMRAVEKRVRPSLIKKLKPQDVDDVCSEVILGFWKFRHSVRPDEVGKLITTLAQRRNADQLQEYYSEAEHQAAGLTAGERELLGLLPGRDGDPGTEAAQEVREVLSDLDLSAQDRVIALSLALGAEKKVIAEVLGLNVDTVTDSLKRCRQAMARRGLRPPKG